MTFRLFHQLVGGGVQYLPLMVCPTSAVVAAYRAQALTFVSTSLLQAPSAGRV